MSNNFTITISAVDKASAVARKVNASIGRITNPVSVLGKEVKALGGHMKVVSRVTGLTQIGKGFNKLGGSAIGAARSVASMITPIAALTSAGLVAGVVELANSFGKTANSVKNAAAVLGLPTQQLQAYEGAARLAGLSSDDMAGGLKSLGSVFEDSVTGRNIEAAGAMNQFGISVHRLKNGSIDTTRALREIANVVQKMPNAQAQQRFASMFGIEQLLPLLQKGGAGIDQLAKKAKGLGAVMTPEQIAAGEKYNEEMIEFDVTADKLKWSLGNALAPAIERVVGLIGRLVDKYGAVVASKVAEYAQKLADWIDRTNWGKVASDVGSFVAEIGGLKTVALAIAAITFWGPIRGIWTISRGIRRMGMTVVPMAIRALGALAKAKSAADAAGAIEGAERAGMLSRLAPLIARLGLPAWLATHSEGLNAGEDEYLAQRRDAGASRESSGAVVGGVGARSSIGGAKAMFSGLEAQYGLPSGLLDSVWDAESMRGEEMSSSKGGQGHFGLVPETARQYGVINPFNLQEAATGTAKMYADLLLQNNGDLPSALAAHKWGSEKLHDKGIFNAPPETQSFIGNVVRAMHKESGELSTFAPATPSFSIAQKRLFVHVDLKNAPSGTTAKVRPSPNVIAEVHIKAAGVGRDLV